MERKPESAHKMQFCGYDPINANDDLHGISMVMADLNVKVPTQARPMGRGLVTRMAFIGMCIGSVTV